MGRFVFSDTLKEEIERWSNAVTSLRMEPIARNMTVTISKKTRLRVTPADIQKNSCPVEEFQTMIVKFAAWLEKAGYASYDPYDIWGTRYGRWARRLYYAKHPVGAALAAPLILMEMICPSVRTLFVKKERFATADAQLALAFLNLHEMSQRVSGQTTVWLAKAKGLAEDLLGYSIPGYSGYCWGYPFDWQNVNGLTPKGTPHITATPYCYEAFTQLFEVTGETCYLEVARSAAAFVFSDLNDTSTGKDAAASSYTPFDRSKVVNASAYRAYVLFKAAHQFGVEDYANKAWKNLRFILQSQRPDGSWLYAIDNAKEAFIDHFHTCFVLKNLCKINLLLKNPAVKEAIENGYTYYRRDLFDRNKLPKSFAIQPRLQISRLEMYNVAEAINLGVLLREYIPEAFAMAHQLASLLRNRFQLRWGYFITRIYFGGLKHKVPFLRWPQAQLFYALTSLLVANGSNAS